MSAHGGNKGLQANKPRPVIRGGSEVAKQSPDAFQLDTLPILDLGKEVALSESPSLLVRLPRGNADNPTILHTEVASSSRPFGMDANTHSSMNMGIRGRWEYMAARLSMRSVAAWAEFRTIVWLPNTWRCMMLPIGGHSEQREITRINHCIP